MRYAQFYTESGIPRIWGKFRIYKKCAYNHQELLAGLMYWSEMNGIDIYTAGFFVKLEIKDMVKTMFNPGGPVVMYESVKSGASPLLVIPRTTQEFEGDIQR